MTGNREILDGRLYYELEHLAAEKELIGVAAQCVQIQREAGARYLQHEFRPWAGADNPVSERSLRQLLANGADEGGATEKRSKPNRIAFDSNTIDDTETKYLLMLSIVQLLNAVRTPIEKIFGEDKKLEIRCSGNFWYPPGGHVGWHTNGATPGWRLYVSHAEEPNRSFFRYLDADSDQVVTSADHEWDFRLFHVVATKPFWHAVYSQTNRFSLGFHIN